MRNYLSRCIMIFVADESVDAPIVHLLRKNLHEVIYIAESFAGATDSYVLELANKEKCILVTQDKDFGELVYRLKQIHSGIILVRLEGISPKEKALLVLSAIKKHQAEMGNNFTVIQRNLIRIRK